MGGFGAGDFAAFGARKRGAEQGMRLVVAREGGAGLPQGGFCFCRAFPEQSHALAQYRVRVRQGQELQAGAGVQLALDVFCLDFNAAGVDDGICPPQNAEAPIGRDFGKVIRGEGVDAQVGDADLQGTP